ncbi:hypothetical protein [Polyangium fumosum]|uniref:Uncharacterized protein n=1 Tax=Polyangium fumosum TaxID=889272 RepID=A0A4U1IUH5_9BACT|nr:hypothetical protein [Polyangium fumosum]TKC98031.1 hypothetical protein E8A74_42980 [Polyangium fumosum]
MVMSISGSPARRQVRQTGCLPDRSPSPDGPEAEQNHRVEIRLLGVDEARGLLEIEKIEFRLRRGEKTNARNGRNLAPFLRHVEPLVCCLPWKRTTGKRCGSCSSAPASQSRRSRSGKGISAASAAALYIQKLNNRFRTFDGLNLIWWTTFIGPKASGVIALSRLDLVLPLTLITLHRFMRSPFTAQAY